MPPCNICGTEITPAPPLYTIDRFMQPFDIHQCPSCGFLFMYPAPDAGELAIIYSEDYYTASAGKKRYTYLDERKNPAGHRAVNTARIARALRAVKKTFLEIPLNFLDVGCSFGALVQEANALGCRACGIDISAYTVDYAQQEGLDVRRASPEAIPDFGFAFHIVSMIEVIEHLPDPRAALAEIARVMCPGGLLIVQTANMDGRQARKAGSAYHYFLPGHLSYFSRKTLSRLLRECGFEKMQTFYPCEFGLLPKLKKSRGNFKSLRDYRAWPRIAWYHLISKIHRGDFALTSGMVIYARRAGL
ncbi:MAG: class I SAM-dependent methyltransferase [Spirochaetota bacterium]|jgi:2-polyprenyl-3-methyl-5-hydroxy-6-metoxy-1,4-benzoquinol methylase|nr:class I SAM-dependent methyltransferase [Spirochaetota bacterium]